MLAGGGVATLGMEVLMTLDEPELDWSLSGTGDSTGLQFKTNEIAMN